MSLISKFVEIFDIFLFSTLIALSIVASFMLVFTIADGVVESIVLGGIVVIFWITVFAAAKMPWLI